MQLLLEKIFHARQSMMVLPSFIVIYYPTSMSCELLRWE